MDDRRVNTSDGRRNGDAWLSRAVKIAALIGACSAPLLAFNGRVSALERIEPALLYMSCVNFGEKHPANEIPAACSQATRQ